MQDLFKFHFSKCLYACSDRGFLDEDANNEEEFYGSDDGFRANENITSTTPLYNNQSFKDKTPRAKWSKQDTELFYEVFP
jgi:transcription factor TFIIIB component B''